MKNKYPIIEVKHLFKQYRIEVDTNHPTGGEVILKGWVGSLLAVGKVTV